MARDCPARATSGKQSRMRPDARALSGSGRGARCNRRIVRDGRPPPPIRTEPPRQDPGRTPGVIFRQADRASLTSSALVILSGRTAAPRPYQSLDAPPPPESPPPNPPKPPPDPPES